jgi:hypothetical protein
LIELAGISIASRRLVDAPLDAGRLDWFKMEWLPPQQAGFSSNQRGKSSVSSGTGWRRLVVVSNPILKCWFVVMTRVDEKWLAEIEARNSPYHDVDCNYWK